MTNRNTEKIEEMKRRWEKMRRDEEDGEIGMKKGGIRTEIKEVEEDGL